MGKRKEGIAACIGSGENNGCGSCEAHHVGVSASKDRRRSKIAMGKAEGGAEKGGVGTNEPAASLRQAFTS
ncbi:MAG TPA: hypothetical protein VNZ03_00505 [Terriglobales bacterium]|nr:hypothetical protein [Terriglobales bacterium]